MKIFTNKKIWSKIIIVLIFVLLFQFVVTKPTLANADFALEMGGKLLSPILSLGVTIGDAIVSLMHTSIMGSTDALLEADMGSTIWEIIGNAFVWLVAAAIAVGLFLLTGGIIGPLLVGIAVGFYGMSVVDDVVVDNGQMVSRGCYIIL